MSGGTLAANNSVAEVYRACDAALTAMRLRYAQIPDRKAFRFFMDAVPIFIFCHDGGLCLYMTSPDNVPPPTRRLVADRMARLNYKLDIGNWEMDFNDGELRFKLGIPFNGSVDFTSLLNLYIDVGVNTFKRGISMLLAADRESGVPRSPGDSALIVACRAGNLAEVKRLIDASADVNTANDAGVTPLMVAAGDGNTELCRLLVEHGADLQRENKNQDTALSLAVFRERLETAHYLLDARADPTHVDKFGDTPLHDAAAHGYLDLCLKLIAAGADKSHRNQNGKTPADRARENGHVEIAELLSS